MNNNEKQDFFDVITTTGKIYDKKIQPDRVSVYWEALRHRTLADVKTAINKHVQDSDRGRFFPVPADISYQLPGELNAWLSANEAWAACPKDESSSSAMCDEMSKALFIAQDLITDGDMIAARMAFIEHYNRLMTTAKSEGKKPAWFPSYGMDKELRFNADREIIERKNLALPKNEWLQLPELREEKQIEYKDLLKLEHEHNPENHKSAYKSGMSGLKEIFER